MKGVYPVSMYYHFIEPIHSLKDNLSRTLMSVLGVSIGVAAFICLTTITSTGKSIVFSELETFGLRSIWIYRNYDDSGNSLYEIKGTGIYSNDLKIINEKCCNYVGYLSPVVAKKESDTIRSNGIYSSASVLGVNHLYHHIDNSKVIYGRFFNNSEVDRSEPVAVIGSDVAKKLFGKLDVGVGTYFHIGTHKVYVIGVLKEKSRALLSSIGASTKGVNNKVLLPYTWVQRINKNILDIDYLQLKSTDLYKVDTATEEVIRFLSILNNHRYSYKSDNMAGYVSTAENILDVVSMVGYLSASIALLVGGIGIMSVMSSSVVERTREIGLRKAVGANNSHIKYQFLLESLVISTFGGVVGVLVGVTLSFYVNFVVDVDVDVSMSIVLFAFLITTCIGILSGYIPAVDASKKLPIESLRHE